MDTKENIDGRNVARKDTRRSKTMGCLGCSFESAPADLKQETTDCSGTHTAVAACRHSQSCN